MYTDESFLNWEKNVNETFKERVISDIRNLLDLQEDCYKPARVRSSWNNNYIKYDSNGDRNKTLSIEEYLDAMKPYLNEKPTCHKANSSLK